jgi:hypothetical protein
LSALKVICGRTGDTEDIYDDTDYEDERVLYDATEDSDAQRPFYWSQPLQQSFREELEKSVPLNLHPPSVLIGYCTSRLVILGIKLLFGFSFERHV